MSPTLGELATAVLQKKYEKPTTGIPLNDLEDNALDDYATKADTVLETTLSRGRKSNSTIGENSIAFGQDVVASGTRSTSLGRGTNAVGGNSVAIGTNSYANGSASIATGYAVVADGAISHAEGQQTAATGARSHSEGYLTRAINDCSHSEGIATVAASQASHTSGMFNIIDSYSSWPEWVASTSYAIGDKVKVTNGTTITGYICKTANSDASFTASKWTEDAKMNYVEIVGNGTADNARSNARALDWDGNEHLMGDVYVGCNADSSGGIKLARLGDVQINGTSIVNDGVANVPIAGTSSNNVGVVWAYAGAKGIVVSNNGELAINPASSSNIKAGTNSYKPIIPAIQHQSVFYGLSKAAGVDLASATVTVGTYPETSKSAIRTMLGATSSNVIAVQDEQPTDSDTKIWLPETAETPVEVPTVAEMNAALAGKVGDVQVNGTSVVSNGVANIPVAGSHSYGAIKVNSYYGIRLVSWSSDGTNDSLAIYAAEDSHVKAGVADYRPLTPNRQHMAAFYGLAKAAGDTTQASSANAVGTYTSEAKAAIHTMLGIDPAAIAAQVDIPLVETVSSTTPTITGQPNTRYVCGEVTTISITPPSAGSVDVIFDSGSTAAVLTVPNTVRWPAWFDATALEADTTYEILITDGVYGSVMTWAN